MGEAFVEPGTAAAEEAAFFVTASPPDSPRPDSGQDTVAGTVVEVPLLRKRPSPLGGHRPASSASGAPHSARSGRSSRSSARGSCSQPYRSWGQGPKWSFDEAFGDVFQQAQEQGVDVFAAAPQPTYRQTATEPKLQSPHLRSSGLVKEESYMARLDGCLTRDFFQRPAWNTSTLPQREPEDLRRDVLETMARDMRLETMHLRLGRLEDRGDAGANTSAGFHPGQGLPEKSPKRKSTTPNASRPFTSDLGSRAAAQSGQSGRCSSAFGGCRRTSPLSDAKTPNSARSPVPARPCSTTPRGVSMGSSMGFSTWLDVKMFFNSPD